PRRLPRRRALGGRDEPVLRRPRGSAGPGRHSPHRSLQPRIPAGCSRKHRIMSNLTADHLAALEQQAIELPSWAFGNSGTRFKVFGTPGTPRDPFEKIADAAQVHKYTALAPSVALHIPWDMCDFD